MEPDPPPPRLDYRLPIAGLRRDRVTGQWFGTIFDPKAGPVGEHGPFATQDEAHAALEALMGDLTS